MKLIVAIVVSVLLSISASLAEELSDETKKTAKEISYSKLRELIEKEEISGATISGYGWWVTVNTRGGIKYYVHVTPDTPIADRLVDAGVPTKFEFKKDDDESQLWKEIFFNLLPLFIFVVLFSFMLRTLNPSKKKYEQEQKEFFQRLEEAIKRGNS